VKIGFKVIKNATNESIGFLKDPLMNLTNDPNLMYCETVNTKSQLNERLRFFNKNLVNIIGKTPTNNKLFTLTENIRIRNYLNYCFSDLSVMPCYSSEKDKI